MTGQGKGSAYVAIAAGVILAWSGVKGKSVSAVIRSVLTGRNPGLLGNANPLIDQSGSDAGSGVGGPLPASDSAIANDAMRYVGVPYLWAGHTPNGWDCSGFVNWVLGVDLHMHIPLVGTFTGASHGPVASAYMVWGRHVPISQMQAGDIVVWPTHIGIVTAPGRMISALSEQYGTKETPIIGWGPKGEPYQIRRAK
jgi:cell wall-associated NlpC family hydrolase